MPIKEVSHGKFQCGNSGKVYSGPSAKKKAQKQAAAAYANGYKGDANGKKEGW